MTAEQVKSKLPAKSPLSKPQVDSILTARKEDLEFATVHGALKLFPEDQWESLLLGPGLDGPSGPHTFVCFSQETVDAVHRSVTWHSLPTKEKSPESYFVYGEGQVLVPRMSVHQPLSVRNPFQSSTNLPFPPPAPFIPYMPPPQHAHTGHTGPAGAHLSSTSSSHLHSGSTPNLAPSTRQLGPAPYGFTPITATNQQGAPKLPDRPPQLPPRAISTNITHSTPAGHAKSQPPPLLPRPATGGAAKVHQNSVAASHSNAGSKGSPSSASHAHIHTTAGYPPTSAQSQPLARKPRSTSSGSSGASDAATSSHGKNSHSMVGIDSYEDDDGSDARTRSKSSSGGSSRCPDEVNGYCRSWNIAHQQVCSYTHLYWSEANDPTGYSAKYKFSMTKLSPGSPEFDYIKIRFINSWIHQSSKKPSVTKIKQVSCPMLEKLFNQRQDAIIAAGVKPNVTELYHGTCEANFTTLFTQGFQPPADYAPHPQCPVSGPYADKLSTSLCKRTCRLCTSMPKHAWGMCHMWGLGIYCAIDSSKSDIYVSNKKGKKNDRTKRKMLLCSVILGEAENVKLLKTPEQMHDRIAPAKGKHSIFASGFKTQTIPTHNGHTLGVMNDEYIVFHPHQIMPLYIIEYTK